MISQDQILHYRKRTYRLDKRIHKLDEAIQFVNERGFIFFWPIKGVPLASLWVAVAGDRPVPNNHDDPAHVTWRWKDDMLSQNVWYYAKVLRKKATLISLEIVPYFYALTENYGDLENDIWYQYQQGKITQEAKALYESILHTGPLDTLRLRKEAKLSSSSSESRFNKALTDLQADFKIVPVGVAEAGAWRYAFIYDLTARKFPLIVEKARWISEEQAYEKLIYTYLTTVGAATVGQIQRLFSWEKTVIMHILQMLKARNLLSEERLDGNDEKWYCITQITEKWL